MSYPIYLFKTNFALPEPAGLAVTNCFTQLWYVFIENMAGKALLLRVLLRQYS